DACGDDPASPRDGGIAGPWPGRGPAQPDGESKRAGADRAAPAGRHPGHPHPGPAATLGTRCPRHAGGAAHHHRAARHGRRLDHAALRHRLSHADARGRAQPRRARPCPRLARPGALPLPHRGPYRHGRQPRVEPGALGAPRLRGAGLSDLAPWRQRGPAGVDRARREPASGRHPGRKRGGPQPARPDHQSRQL
ncbi:MAG: hypothetical protein AVDCRST_MAG27-3865, partial [uncultured Craurococcus sp.]